MTETAELLVAAVRERDAADERLRRAVLNVAAGGVGQRQIARILDISQPAVSQMLAASRSKMLGRSPIGRLVLSHHGAILATAKAHQALRLRVFGSVARAEDGPSSDLDLLVAFPRNAGMLKSAALGDELSDLLGVPVDVVPDSLVKADALAALNEASIIL